MEQPLISIVDDDETVRDATERLMRSAGFSAETFSRGVDFLSSPDLSRKNDDFEVAVATYESAAKRAARGKSELKRATPASRARAWRRS
jgi:DNA-binding NtrC family response regulator